MLVEAARAAISAGAPDSARRVANDMARRLLRPVINGTGTLLHTNLGRAPMSWSQAEQYSNLELDLTTGERGSRMATAPALIARACGAEAAIVVNNCAAAVLLALASLAEGKGVVVSRGELVEIGGGFRVPDVMARSGARLIEVGTTNRTRLADFKRAIDEGGAQAALVLQVHQSNYKIVGYTEAPRTAELATLNRPLIADIGSGLVDSRCPWLPGGASRMAGRRASRSPNSRGGCRSSDILRRQTLRWATSGHHRGTGGSGGNFRGPPAGPCSEAWGLGARRFAGHCSRLSQSRR